MGLTYETNEQDTKVYELGQKKRNSFAILTIIIAMFFMQVIRPLLGLINMPESLAECFLIDKAGCFCSLPYHNRALYDFSTFFDAEQIFLITTL